MCVSSRYFDQSKSLDQTQKFYSYYKERDKNIAAPTVQFFVKIDKTFIKRQRQFAIAIYFLKKINEIHLFIINKQINYLEIHVITGTSLWKTNKLYIC